MGRVTTQYSGASNIADTAITSASPTFNFGAGVAMELGVYGGTTARGLVRMTGTIPAGNITGARFFMFMVNDAGNMLNPGTLYAMAVKDANSWVVGTANGANQAGSCDWSYAKDAGQAWAGAAGCSTAGTDYDNDTSWAMPFPNHAAGWYAIALNPQWFMDWRDSVRTNNGFLLKTNEAANAVVNFYSTDWSSNKPYIELDVGSLGGSRLRRLITRGR